MRETLIPPTLFAPFLDLDWPEITTRFPTPFYLYDGRAMRQRATMVKGLLGEGFRLYYAVKANPNPHILHLLAPVVDGFDISSGGELALALALGIDPGRLSFAGPGKTEADLLLAVSRGVGSISVESHGELARIAAIARATGCTAQVAARLNPQRLFKNFAIKMGGKPSQFGVDEVLAPDFLHALAHTPGCRLVGLHVYAGTQCLDEATLLENMENTLKLADTARQLGIPVASVNLGGGFGVAYFDQSRPLDGAAVCRGFVQRFAPYRQHGVAIVELGRFLVAEAGIFVARVVEVKSSRDTLYVILDGGLNHHLPASGNFGQVIRRNYPLYNLTGQQAAATVTVTGPLCTSIDILGDQVRLSQPRVGDLIAIGQSGAYGYTASPLAFLSHPTPWELLRDEGGAVHMIRERFDPTLLGVPPLRS